MSPLVPIKVHSASSSKHHFQRSRQAEATGSARRSRSCEDFVRCDSWTVLIERRLGPARLFVNAENLLNISQTRYDPLVRPQQHFDGKWTVDAWTLLEGRVMNAGLRFSF